MLRLALHSSKIFRCARQLPESSLSALSFASVTSGRELRSRGLTSKRTPRYHRIVVANRQKTSSMGENIENVTPEEAPFPLTDVDKWVLSQTDEEYDYHTWEELCNIIRTVKLVVLFVDI